MQISEKIKQLGDKDRKVLEHFLEHGREKAAYLSFYHKAKPFQVKEFFSRKLVKEVIKMHKEGVEEKVVEIMAKQSYDKAYVQSRLAKLCDFNIVKFLKKDPNGNGMIYDFANATDDDWYCITEYTGQRIMAGGDQDMYPVEQIKLKAADKIKALELMGKTVGAYTDKIEHTGIVNVIMDTTYDFEEENEEEQQ
jgi:hypothetical protein